MYDELVLAGATVTVDPTRRWVLGSDVFVDLLVCAAAGEVRVRTSGGDQSATSPHVTAVVINFYRRRIEECDRRRPDDE
ncbi:hypothetical protein [Kutzneria sp. 744]|uniref:hypothetical protein n=1 Tax=Kutzneria sp. (strain 744) TaxID=345341 RepID=UPI0003EEDB02|nr:hypothetical protein [Kutzneria sp. 744]EWM19866.1 hypothetical protein KUTG_10170 [Kutzneria sp. 744]